jgi:tetratricopeptide (TPR) repeat protein
MTDSKKTTNPFPGLRPFESDEYRVFFGREGQADALISRLQRSRFLAVVGTSGSGKSSLVRAGLLPALRGGMMAGAGSGWRIAIMRPGSDPIGNLALALAKEEVLLKAGGGLPQAEVEAIIDASLRRGALGLVEVARQAQLAEHEKLLVVVDQFEELFRFRAARGASSTRDDASAFVKLLIEASQQREISIYVVPTMRSDFLGDCAQFQGLPEAINDGQYLIPRMTRDERRFAITGPVGVTRGKITEPLVNRLMNDVGDNPDQLPILQHALMRTWNYWAAHRLNGDPIGLEHYEAVGTMSSALSQHADEAYNELPDERSRLIAEILFKALTERGADNREIRRPTCLKDICNIANASQGEVSKVIEVFRGGGRSFLMPPAGVPLEPETVIDISHESLIRNWDRLQAWVKDEAESARIYRRLAGAATDYHQGAGGVLDDVTLQYLLKWQERSKPGWHWGVRYHPDYNTAMAYLERSTLERDVRIEEEQERERRELQTARTFADKQARAARRMRWLAAGMAVMFVLALGTAAAAFVAQRQAVQKKAEIASLLESQKELLKSEQKERQRASDAEDRAEAEFKKAEGERDKALAASKEALAEQARAEREELRATEQERIAAKSLIEEQLAKKAAEANLDKFQAAVQRSNLTREGLDKLGHEEYEAAIETFDCLQMKLVRLQAGGTLSHESTDDRCGPDVVDGPNQFALELGWTLSKIGTAHWKAGGLQKAIKNYEDALNVFKQHTPHSKYYPLLLETYKGLGHSYFAIAKMYASAGGYGEDDAWRAAWKNYDQAEKFLKLALAFQDEHKLRPAEVAGRYLDLARLYAARRNQEAAEKHYRAAIDRMPKHDDPKEIYDALAELAQFHQIQGRSYNQSSYYDAARVYNELITMQEGVHVLNLGEKGQAIANSYNELSEIYRAQDKTAEATSAQQVANLLENVALKLRRARAEGHFDIGFTHTTSSFNLQDDLDQLGDAYAKLGKFDKAAASFQQALINREKAGVKDPSLWKSYNKLAKLYRSQKDYANAEDNLKLLLEFYQSKPRSAEYAGALMQLGSLHAETDKYADAELKYAAALGIYKERKDWWNENLIHFRLSKLFEKQGRLKDREQALNDRVHSLQGYFDQVITRPRLPTDFPTLASEYLQAVNALGFFYDKSLDDKPRAAAAYQRAYTASPYIVGKIYNVTVLKFYAVVLEDYRILLHKLGQKALMAQVELVAQGIKEKLNQDDERKQQNALQIQQSSSEGTYATPQ